MTIDSIQWGLFSADLNPVVGSEQAGQRPVLVISREVINQALPIVAVVPFTRAKPGRRIYPTEVLLPAGAAGQREDSIAMAHQLRTISSYRLGEPIGHLTDPDLRNALRQAVKTYLYLD